MGRVFSFEQIKNRQVPDPSHFEPAKNITLNWMRALLQEGEIVGGQVFGSVAHGTATKRSDFDLILVTTEASIPDRIRSHRDLIANAFHIPIEPILVPLEFAHTPLHSMDYDFLFHMSKVDDENVVGEHPASLITPNNPDIIGVHTGYLSSKLRKFRDGFFIEGQDAKIKTLQRAFEAPVSIGRRTLRTLGIPQVDKNGAFDDTKGNITRIFREKFGGTSLGDGFEACLARDRMYTELLDKALLGNVPREEYEDFINGEGYDIALAQSLAWTSDIALFFNRAVEGNKTHIEGHGRGKELI